MIQHVIADLHLSEEQPHLVRLFDHYLENFATKADTLFILGDLFEVWIGDDYQPEWLNNITQRLRQLSQHCAIYFCHGNRDFLLGESYAERAGMTLLSEYETTQLLGCKTLLCHGDTLCTDDVAYQEFRQQVRTQQWQSQFLALPIEQRLAIVNDYRAQSKQATAEKNDAIMDVNLNTVAHTVKEYDATLLIHGHTHRPAIHQESFGPRLVVSDWRKHGHFLELSENSATSCYFEFNSCNREQWL